VSDYLDHLASVSLSQTRGFQFNPSELRPRLASQFEPAVPNASPAAWVDDEVDEVESPSVDRASSRSRMISGQARVSAPSAETPSLSETEVYPAHQSLTAAPAEHELFDRVPRLANANYAAASQSTVSAMEQQASEVQAFDIYEAQLDLRDENASVRTRSSPVAGPRQGATVVTLRQPAQRRQTRQRGQSPASLAPQAAFVEVKRFLDSMFYQPSEQLTLYAQPSDPGPSEIKESQDSSAAEFIEVGSNEDDVSPPVSNKHSRSTAEKAHSLHSSRLTVTPPAHQVGTRHFKLNRREGQVDRSVEDEPPAAPTIQVTIGRVEVRAETTPATSAPRSRSAPVMTLEDYLQRRKTGGGQ